MTFNDNTGRGLYIKNSNNATDATKIIIDKIFDIKVLNNTDGGINFSKNGNKEDTLQIKEISNIEVKNNTKTSGTFPIGIENLSFF